MKHTKLQIGDICLLNFGSIRDVLVSVVAYHQMEGCFYILPLDGAMLPKLRYVSVAGDDLIPINAYYLKLVEPASAFEASELDISALI